VMMLWCPTGEAYARERITVFVRAHGFAKWEVELGRRICKRLGADWRRATGVRFAKREGCLIAGLSAGSDEGGQPIRLKPDSDSDRLRTPVR